jgi:hypothetical protein
MNVAYLILAHADPNHLSRLIAALREDWTCFYVHIDKKARMRDFGLPRTLPQTRFIEQRVDACWGGFSLVQATLNLMAAARRDKPTPERYVLLSGADYPIRSNVAFRSFLEASDREFISLLNMPTGDGRKSLVRLERLHFEGSRSRPMPKRVFLTQTNRLLEKIYKRNYRRVLGDMRPYASSQWWVLSRDAVDYILEFVRENRRLVRFYKHSVIPDEMFFHTILGNSPFGAKAARNLTYADWPKGFSRNPVPLTAEHVERFTDPNFLLDDVEGIGPCFFARKFSSWDRDLLDRVDAIRSTASGGHT